MLLLNRLMEKALTYGGQFPIWNSRESEMLGPVFSGFCNSKGMLKKEVQTCGCQQGKHGRGSRSLGLVHAIYYV